MIQVCLPFVVVYTAKLFNRYWNNYAVVQCRPCGYGELILASCSIHASWKQLTWWRHQMEIYSALLAHGRGIHRSPVNSPYKGQWRGALMSPLTCALITGWRNDREVGDLRSHRAHYDVPVMVTDRRCAILYVDILNFIQIWISQNFKG